MKIELKQRHKSITDLNTEELPDFAILIGRNGAGKTQLLEALNEGTVLFCVDWKTGKSIRGHLK